MQALRLDELVAARLPASAHCDGLRVTVLRRAPRERRRARGSGGTLASRRTLARRDAAAREESCQARRVAHLLAARRSRLARPALSPQRRVQDRRIMIIERVQRARADGL